NIDRILDVARRSGAQAIHPGYGFLAENTGFVRACGRAGITFVGPPAEAMDKVGDKIQSRRTMRAAGVPIIPGTTDPVSDPREAANVAAEIGYPVLLKASAGGGGTGIRVVQDAGEFDRAIANVRAEAKAAFGDDTVFVEKLLRPARHIEIQVIADAHGNVVTLGERECSIQRRRQKLIEESPAPGMTPELRARMQAAAKSVVRACDYRNAGTVEFLVYDETEFAFLEMNARLQVEHPVTELVRGVDLVADQLRIAAGRPLGYTEADRPSRGWAMECRITAEDPYRDFLPTTGAVAYYREPAGPGIRVDGMLHPGMEVSVHYDSLLAKLVAWGEDRDECRRRMQRALREFTVVGVSTSIPFHLAMLSDPRFIAGDISTEYLETAFRLNAEARPETTESGAMAAAAFLWQQGELAPAAQMRNGRGGGAWAASARARRTTPEQGWRRNST
ncbi:MAG: biotin carboxylase N-terminal domain-containing protein, partial [Dehalococcoidia bacterium]